MSDEPRRPRDDIMAEVMNDPNMDWFLLFLITQVEDYMVEQGITLLTGGLLVSGALISGDTYFKELGDTIKAADTVAAPLFPNGKTFAEIFAETCTNFRTFYSEQPGENELPLRPKRFIHLRNARFYTDQNGTAIAQGKLWRGRLSAVDGFVVGNLEQRADG